MPTDQELLATQRRLQQQHGIKQDPPGLERLDIAQGFMAIAEAQAEKGAERETEYMGPDGLLRCRICDGPRQTVVTLPFEGAKPRTVRCWCGCPTEQDKSKAREEQIKLEQRRSVCFRGTEELARATFDADDGTRPDLIQAAKAYAADFKAHMADGLGLLYHGPIGTGKTFLAACIANEVLRKGYRVRLASFSALADEMFSVSNKAEYIADLARYPLLILDDLGVERKSEYMQETVYKIVNARYVAGLPVIVTTNLTPDELAKPADVGYARTYDRLLERCLPILVDGGSRRRRGAGKTWTDMRQKLGLAQG